MHNALTHNAPCSIYHLETPCLIKTKQQFCMTNETKNAVS